MDLAFVGLVVVLTALSIGFVSFCERLRRIKP